MKIPDPEIESIERAIIALTDRSDSELTIPAAVRGVTAFCAESALLQFVVTWARVTRGAGSAIFSDLDAGSQAFEGDLRRQLGIPYFVAAWVLAGRLCDTKQNALKRRDAKSYAEFLDAMDAFEFQRTHDTPETRANLVCVQGGKREFIRPFYEPYKSSWLNRVC